MDEVEQRVCDLLPASRDLDGDRVRDVIGVVLKRHRLCESELATMSEFRRACVV